MGRWFQSAERLIGRIAQHRARSALVVGLLSFILSAALSLLVRMPQPCIHDEFSYLLAADTFAHGRLSNPTHPLWVHFESMHIIHRPSYASKYPPGQGLVLAAGQVLGGHPIVGAWLSTALACAAVCWMLMAWLPPRWALVGGLLAVVHPMVLGWSQCYWGGSVAMGGGALVLGAWRRLVARPRARDAWLMGLGMAVLANSRPYEGMVLSLMASAALLAWMVGRNGPAVRVSLRRIVLPIVVVLGLTGGAMSFYNLRVTGYAGRMPYMVHEATYAVAPPFLWQDPRPEPAYQHKELRDFYVGWVLPWYSNQRSPHGLILCGLMKISVLIHEYFSAMGLLIPLVALPWVLRNRWMRFALLACAGFTMALLLETWIQGHYAAPVSGLVLLLVVQAMRHLRLWRRRGSQAGRLIVHAILALSVAWLVPYCLGLARFDQAPHYRVQMAHRARLLAGLRQAEGRHLVIVRYGPTHDMHAEWVYNEADIDGAKVVWAREMDPAHNRKLIEYFGDRHIWLLEPDAQPLRLSRYPIHRLACPALLGSDTGCGRALADTATRGNGPGSGIAP